MPQRDLRVVATEKVIGSVILTDGEVMLVGAARDVFAQLLSTPQLGVSVGALMRDGWSNGYLYLATES